MNGIENLPKSNVLMVEASGHATQPWFRFFERMFSKPPSEQSVTVTASPFLKSYDKDGFIIIEGGTVSDVEYLRGSQVVVAYSMGVQRQVVVKRGDAVQITYSVAPTVNFFPD